MYTVFRCNTCCSHVILLSVRHRKFEDQRVYLGSLDISLVSTSVFVSFSSVNGSIINSHKTLSSYSKSKVYR